MRALQAGHLVPLASGLWVVDACQPVAAVLDPDTGALRTLVSWPEVPPPAVEARRRVVLGDGESLWFQDDVGSPVVRVDARGLATSTAVDPSPSQMQLAAVGRGVAWCRTPHPEAVHARTGAGRGSFPGHGELRRVDADGAVEVVRVERGVEEVHATPEGLVVGVPSSVRRDWRGGRGFVETRRVRWSRIPWDAPVPAALGEERVLPGPFVPPSVPDLRAVSGALAHGQGPPARTDGLDWFAEPSPVPAEHGPSWERMRVRAVDPAGAVVADWDLGGGSVVTMTALGGRVAVAVAREPRSAPGARADRIVDVLVLDPRDGSSRVVLRGGSLDVTAHCRPVGPRPVDADSHVRRAQEAAAGRVDRLRRAGARDVRVAVVGSWPLTLLQTTMAVPTRPGVRLRLRVPLFDELGRALGPGYADAGLADSLDVGFLPPAEDARDGFLDV